MCPAVETFGFIRFTNHLESYVSSRLLNLIDLPPPPVHPLRHSVVVNDPVLAADHRASVPKTLGRRGLPLQLHERIFAAANSGAGERVPPRVVVCRLFFQADCDAAAIVCSATALGVGQY